MRQEERQAGRRDGADLEIDLDDGSDQAVGQRFCGRAARDDASLRHDDQLVRIGGCNVQIM